MRSQEEVEQVLVLFSKGVNDSQIARATSVPRSTVRDWKRARSEGHCLARSSCPICAGDPTAIAESAYAYLLGVYLGDGHIVRAQNGRSYRLRIFLDLKYPGIIEETEKAIREVMPGRAVNRLERHLPQYPNGGVMQLSAYSQHWPCVFPQHGPGRKHERKIRLVGWQDDIVRRWSGPLLRGFIHSDGCRSMNAVTVRGRRYEYSRYLFSNRSDDIRGIFCESCDRLGIDWRVMNSWTISIARRQAVWRMDQHVGPNRDPLWSPHDPTAGGMAR